MHKNYSRVDIVSIKQSVVKIVILFVITFSLYQPVWLLKVRLTINKLSSNIKISAAIPVIFLLIATIYLLVAFFEGGIEALSPGSLYLGYLSSLSNILFYMLIVCNISIILMCFQIRRILLNHYGANLSISAFATFFFGIFYLQHKINKL